MKGVIPGDGDHFELRRPETDFYRFRARLHVVLEASKGSIRGQGVVTQGWRDGAQVRLEADLVPGGVAGVMRLLSGSAN